MDKKLLFNKIIPILLYCAWLGSCAAGVTQSDYNKSESILIVCTWIFYLILIYYPIKTIVYWKPKEAIGNKTAIEVKRKGVAANLLSFFILMIFIAFISLYSLPGLIAYKKNRL